MRDPDLNGAGELRLERVGLVRAEGFRRGSRTEGLLSRGVPDLADRARVGDIKVRFQDALSPMVDPQVQELHAGGEAAGGEETAQRDQGEDTSPLDFIRRYHPGFPRLRLPGYSRQWIIYSPVRACRVQSSPGPASSFSNNGNPQDQALISRSQEPLAHREALHFVNTTTTPPES